MKEDKRNLLKKIKNLFYNWKKGTRGAISLLMAILISPLLSISLVLVESVRYQDAIALVEELNDSASFSTIAEYDDFLDERFGLLATSQEIDISNTFSDYVKDNRDLLGNYVDLKSYGAIGQYPLSDTHVLKQQVLEASELSVPAEATINAINLEELIENLEEALGLEEFTKDIKALNAGIDVAKEVEKLLESTKKTIDHYNNSYKPALDSYNTKYQEFETSILKYVEALNNLETAQQTASTAASAASSAQSAADADSKDKSKQNEADEAKKESDKAQQELQRKQQEFNTAKTNLDTAIGAYKTANGTLSTHLETLKGYVDDLLSALEQIPVKLQNFKNESSDSVASDCTTTAYDWLMMIVGQATTMIKNSVGGNAYKDKVNQEIRLLGEQLIKLNGVSSSTVTKEWNSSKIKSEYGTVSIVTFGSVFILQLSELIDKLNRETALSTDAKASLEDLIMIAKELIGISGIYDENLDSVVASSKMYASTHMSISSELSVHSLTSLITACEEFTSGMSSFNVFKAIKALVKFLEAVVAFLAAVVMWAADMLANVFGHVAGGLKEMYNSLLLYGYAAYNLPNRTTIYDKESLNGYSFGEIFDLAGGVYSADSIKGSLAEFSSFGSTEGTDEMFKGAEGEYILVGSNSELQNQAVTFFDLYVLRLLLDIMQVFKAPEVSALAALAGPGALVVKILIAMAEPMLDTIVLVNGGKQYLIKKTIYFSYAGIILLGNDLTDISCVSENLKKKIKDLIKTHNGSPSDKGIADLSYNEYLLLLTMLMVDQQEYMQRLRNLIQMEAVKKYGNSFSVNKAYTYIKSNLTYEINPMFELDGLSDSGLLTVDISRYSGY